MKTTVAALVALASLSGCLLAAVLVFLGQISAGAFKTLFLVSSALWFVAATFWLGKKREVGDETA